SVTVNAPPQPPFTAMSSPRQNTVGSRRISSAMPSRSDSAMLSRFTAASREHIGRQIIEHRQWLLARQLDGRAKSRLHPVLNVVKHCLVRKSATLEDFTQAVDRVASKPCFFLFLRLIVAAIAPRMTSASIRQQLEQDRPSARAAFRSGRPRGL